MTVWRRLQSSSAQAKRAQLFRTKIDGVQNWMRVRHLPKSIRQKIEWYYGEIWVRHAGAHVAHALLSADCWGALTERTAYVH